MLEKRAFILLKLPAVIELLVGEVRIIMRLIPGYSLSRPSEIFRNVLWRIQKTISKEPHIFVMGAPRSGTTLLQTILSVHSKISGSEGESGIFTRQNVFDTKRRYCDLSEEKISRIISRSHNVVDFFDAVASEVLKCSGGERFLEKTPQHVLNLRMLVKYFPCAYFICVYRDGRDCFCSAREHRGVPQGTDLGRYAKYWRRCIRSQLSIGSNANVLQVKYEDLTRNPEEVVGSVNHFLGLAYEPGQIDSGMYSKDRRSSLPEFAKLNGPIDTASQQRWKQNMNMCELEVFDRIAGKELLALGYEVSRCPSGSDNT